MSLTHRTLPALYNGVSQQPAILRTPDQSEDELNTWASLADGLTRRPPTEHIAKLTNSALGDATVHHINRDATERYVVVIDQGSLRVFDHLTGAEKTVNAPGGLGYLSAPGSRYSLVTVADYTFVVNRDKAVALAAVGADTVLDPNYAIWLAKSTAGIYGGWTGLAAGLPYQYAPNPVLGGLTGEVQQFDKLPDTALNGALYKITGSVETGFVSYYVRKNGAVWDEAVGPGLKNSLDAATMPHALIREANGTFTFAPFSWAPRRVGDDQTNPPPTFVGRTIRDVFFYQNRLGFLVDENVLFSAASDFGNFWRMTVLDYLASDPVDVAVTTAQVALLNYAVPFNDGMMLFADQVQFSLSNGENGLSADSVAIRPVTGYEVNTTVRPVTLGTEVYFASDYNGKTVIREYTRLADSDSTSAADVTAHVPRYVPSGLTKLIAANDLNALFAITGPGSSEVYVYQLYWSAEEKVQSSWRKWEFNGVPVSGAYLDGCLYLVFDRADGATLEAINLKSGAVTGNLDFLVYLDRTKAATGTYDGTKTVFPLAYAPDQASFRLVRPGTHTTRPGSLIDPSQYTWLTSSTVSVPGNEAGTAYGGETYITRYEFSRQYPADRNGKYVTSGRLQLRTFTVNFVDTGYFRTEVFPYGTSAEGSLEDVIPSKLADFTGKVVGSGDLILNQPTFHTGSYSFQVYGDAAQAVLRLSNDTHVGSTFVSAEWEGFYFNRAIA